MFAFKGMGREKGNRDYTHFHNFSNSLLVVFVQKDTNMQLAII